MKASVTVILLGEPAPFSRARVNTVTGHVTPENSRPRQRNVMNALRWEAKRAMQEANHGAAVFDEPLRMDLRAEFAIPKRMAKRDRPLALSGEIRPAKRPDADNLYKLVADALNNIVFRDDALIVEARITKVYSDQPKIVVTVQPISTSYLGPLASMVRDLPNDALEDEIESAKAAP